MRSASATAGSTLLTRSGQIWFAAAAIGQAIFIYFILGFYGPRTASGAFETWNDKGLIDGYIPDDGPGNTMFIVHVLLAALITFGGLVQLVPAIRNRARAFHRWNGRVFLTVAVIMALSGIWLVWARGTYLNIVSAWSITLNGVLILAFGAMALRTAMARDFDSHRRWAIRTFLMVSGVWFLRVGISAWVLINQGAPGMTAQMDGPFDRFWAFGNFLVPLLVAELYFLAQASASPLAKRAVAGLVLGLTALMAVGIAGAYLLMWAPHL